MLGRTPYEALVCDVNLGTGMDGVELTTQVRARASTRDLPVVLVSAQDGGDTPQRGVTAGADAFLGKRDCGHGRLLAEVSAAVARRRARS